MDVACSTCMHYPLPNVACRIKQTLQTCPQAILAWSGNETNSSYYIINQVPLASASIADFKMTNFYKMSMQQRLCVAKSELKGVLI